MCLLVITMDFLVQLSVQGLKIIADWQSLVIILFFLGSIHLRISIALLITEMTPLKNRSMETPLRYMCRGAMLPSFIICRSLVGEIPSMKLILCGMPSYL